MKAFFRTQLERYANRLGELEFLLHEECDEAQGYFLSRPIVAAAFAAWVDAYNHDVSRSAAA